MKITHPEERTPWWVGKRFYCQCGSLIELERIDQVRVVQTRGFYVFQGTHWFFHCPVCNGPVRFDDRILDGY